MTRRVPHPNLTCAKFCWKPIRFEDVPDVDIVLLTHSEMPYLGGDEASTVPVAAAIANAIFDAIGVRLREVPLNPKRVLSALRGKPAPAVRS